jgi:hypothetical protein
MSLFVFHRGKGTNKKKKEAARISWLQQKYYGLWKTFVLRARNRVGSAQKSVFKLERDMRYE